MIDPRLETFKLAAQLNNFTRTAEALGTTQPNVTRQIRELEARLGVTLFERNGRNVRLTSPGEVLRQEVERLESAAATLRRKVANAGSRYQHRRLGATMTAGGYVLPRMLAGYLEKTPDLRIDLVLANTAEITEKLKRRELDLALVEGPFDRDFFFSRKLLEDELRPWGRAELLGPGGKLSLTAYLRNGGKLILREKGSGTRYAFERFLQQHDINIPDGRIMTVNDFNAIRQLVERKAGITVISEWVIADAAPKEKLTAGRSREGRIRREMNFIYTPDSPLPFAEALIGYCCRIKTF